MPGIVHKLGEFRRFNADAEPGGGLNIPVQFFDLCGGFLAVRADYNAAGFKEILNGTALAQEFRVGYHMEVRTGDQARDFLDNFAQAIADGSGGNSAADDN